MSEPMMPRPLSPVLRRTGRIRPPLRTIHQENRAVAAIARTFRSRVRRYSKILMSTLAFFLGLTPAWAQASPITSVAPPLIFALAAIGVMLALFFVWRSRSLHRRQLEEALDARTHSVEILRRRLESMDQAQAIAHLGNWDWDLASGHFAWSDEVFRIFGMEPRGMHVGLDAYLQTFEREEGQAFQAALNRALSVESGPIRQKRRVLLPDGSHRVVREVAEVTRNAQGRPVRMVGTIYDITGRHRAEMALRENEERFRSLARSANDAIISTDADGRILFWNSGAEALFGYREAEIRGQKADLIIPPRFREAHAKGQAEAARSGRIRLQGRSAEMVGLRKNGEEFPLEISLSSWVSGGQRRFSAIVRDITERRRLERERQRAFQTRITLSALLETALEPMSQEEQLKVALAIIHTIPWLSNPGKGAVFLLDPETGAMRLTVQQGLAGESVDHKTPSQLLGRDWDPAVSRRDIVFAPVASTEGDRGAWKGCYGAPINSGHRLLGAMVLFRGGADEGRNPEEEEGVLHSVANTLASIMERRRMEAALEQSAQALRETRLEIIRRLSRASEYRDSETGLHVIRMSHYAAVLGKTAGLDPGECELLLHAAPMHDVGKIGIPDMILLKQGPLEEAEFEAMKRHAEIGASMLFGHGEEPLKTAHIMALTHHEKWDGSGYPVGLRGEEIPLVGRICAIADVFDALTSERPYKKAWSVEKAVAEIDRCSGVHFDPALVARFKQALPEILTIRAAYPDAEEGSGLESLEPRADAVQ